MDYYSGQVANVQRLGSVWRPIWSLGKGVVFVAFVATPTEWSSRVGAYFMEDDDNWNPDCDFNRDSYVGLGDYTVVVTNYDMVEEKICMGCNW
jgi:hypothetical protein